MSRYVLPGMLGLLVGLLLHWAGFSRQVGLRKALGLRRSFPLCSGLTAVGWSMAVTALLCWLAVIDVDTITVLPLSAGALLGGAVLGIAAGLCGFTPSTAFAGLGGGRALEALCTLAGCGVMTLLLPEMRGLLTPLWQAAPYVEATLFRVTLDEAFLLGGGFLGQGCAGGVLVVIAMAAVIGLRHPEGDMRKPAAVEDAAAPEAVPEMDAAADTIIALLPGEEPLVVDSAEVEDAPEQEPEEDEDEPEDEPEGETADEAEDESEDEEKTSDEP